MTMILYGIPNCSTVKKARSWLDARGTDYAFHDYRKAGADPAKLAEWSKAAGWEALLNRRGTTFRKLDRAETADLDESRALRLMAANPSLIRRPVVEHGGGLLVGFDEAEWQRVLA
jgi:Spx/MgsR family transcriptional regulator